MYKILIIEDEVLIAEAISSMISELGHQVIYMAKEYNDAIEKINQLDFDLALVDINLESKEDGIKIAKKLNALNKSFIFLSSYCDKDTINIAKQTNPDSYIIKPASKQELFTNIEIVMAKSKVNNSNAKNLMRIKDGYKTHLINQNDIKVIKADRVYLEIHLEDKVILQRCSFNEILDKIDKKMFCRVHRSYVINLKKVNSVASNYVLINNDKIPISLSYKKEFISKFNEIS